MPTPLAIGLGIGIPKCYYFTDSIPEWSYFTDDDEQDGYFVDDGFTARLISKDA